MKYLKQFSLYESNNTEITIYDVAWLYLLCFPPYSGRFKVDSWKNDIRMDMITTCSESLSKFSGVTIVDGYYTSNDDCIKIVEEWFGGKKLIDYLIKSTEVEKFNKSIPMYSYPISSIPLSIYLKNNPSVDKSIDLISDRIRIHYNSQVCNDRIIKTILKSRNLDKFNLIKFHKSFPNFPKSIKIYRGLKNKPKDSYNSREYSCWTYSKPQAERFAKFKFTGGMQFEPIYSDDPYILETEINIDDIAIFIGGEESEIIVKNPVENIRSYKYII